ncbi:MAG TPA: hypothetical protein VHF28_00365 [Nitrososphaera sp.]|nr:hypothetical protein [Nitrososphaera sp.]
METSLVADLAAFAIGGAILSAIIPVQAVQHYRECGAEYVHGYGRERRHDENDA